MASVHDRYRVTTSVQPALKEPFDAWCFACSSLFFIEVREWNIGLSGKPYFGRKKKCRMGQMSKKNMVKMSKT